MGKVYLIGAGPGDEELITLKAVRILSKCTAVMYDRLAGEEILKFLDDNCEIYFCGKEPGCHYKTQDEINDMLILLSKQGHTVGRIKGGDPYVFGRGGEEALRLIEEGIEFEVIPGITSAISVLNYAGIPVTHRKISQSFHVYTGMSAEKLNIDWKSAATTGGTLIFLMGYDKLQLIIRNLTENGLSKDTPCAIVMRGTTSKQRKVVGTLENIKESAEKLGFSSPCIIVVGETVNFSDKLNWYEKKPLFGKNICITRSKQQSKELREALLDLGAEVTEINSIEIINKKDNLSEYMHKLSNYEYIAFTSVNSVDIFFDYLIEKNYDVRNIKASIAAIGPATDKAIRKKGIVPQILADEFVAESLFEKMKTYVRPGQQVLLPRSSSARPFLTDALKKFGCVVDEVYIYDTVCGKSRGVSCNGSKEINRMDPIENKVSVDKVDIIIFTSPSTVRNLISMAGIEAIKQKNIIAIGPITAKELKNSNIKCLVCDEYSVQGIVKKLLEK